MTFLVSAMAAGIPAPRVTAGEGPGQQLGWDGETAEQLKLALPEACGLRTSWFFLHIVAIMLQAKAELQVISERENRTLFLHSFNSKGKSHLSGGFNRGGAYVPR
jgi:hypothetical protein